MKRRSALVISCKQFNEHTEFAIVTPIASTKRNIALELDLPKSLKPKRVTLIYQVKPLDHKARNIAFSEKVPQELIDEATKLVKITTE